MVTTRPAVPSLERARPLREVLDTPILDGATVLAGVQGLDRLVDRLNIMEVPDILPWVKPGEFLLTTAYPLREQPESLTQLVADLDDAGLAGLGIKLGRYVDELPADMLALADDRGFAIVRLPEDVGFDEIFNEVLTSLLNRQAQKLERSERIHHAFLEIVLQGRGLPEIAENLAELIDGPAVVVGLDGQVLAAARTSEVAAWHDGVERVEVLADDRRICVDGTDVGCVRVPVSAGPRLHGHVVALPGAAGLTDDRQALEVASTVAALSMTMRSEVQAVEDKYQSDLMHDLLTGRAGDPQDAMRRASSFGWDLDRRVIALVVRFDDPSEPVVPDEFRRRPPLATTIRAPILQRDQRAAIVRFSDEVVVLTAAFDGDTGRLAARAFAQDLARTSARTIGVSVSAGLSRPVTDLAAVPRAYEQATAALRIGRRIHGRGAVMHFDDLGVYRVLSLLEDTTELRQFAEETLGELAADSEQMADLRHTLEVLLDTNVNVAEAARRLHFHYNTLRYRIEKLERMVGPFTEDARCRLDVHVALLILQMRHLDDV